MPFEAALAGAAAQGGAAIVSGAQNALFTGLANRASRKWSERMYERQFNDNVRFWQMQNAYNSPESQMQRFKAAGLNPNLVYSQGNPGNAGTISTPDVQRPEFRVPDLDNATRMLGGAIGTYLDYEIKQAQADNLRAQNTSILEDAMLKQAQRQNVLQNTARSIFDLDRDKTNLDTYFDAQREQLRQLKVSTDVMLNRDEREAVKLTSDLSEAAQRIKNMRGELYNKDLESQIKRLDVELKRMGIQPTDPMKWRILGRILATEQVDMRTMLQTIRGSLGDW